MGLAARNPSYLLFRPTVTETSIAAIIQSRSSAMVIDSVVIALPEQRGAAAAGVIAWAGSDLPDTPWSADLAPCSERKISLFFG